MCAIKHTNHRAFQPKVGRLFRDGLSIHLSFFNKEDVAPYLLPCMCLFRNEKQQIYKVKKYH